MKWKQLIKKLNYWKAEEDKIYDAWVKFNEVFAPNEYASIPQQKYVDAYLSAINLGKELEELLSWYLYEAPSFKEATLQRDGKTWDANKEGQFEEYLETYY